MSGRRAPTPTYHSGWALGRQVLLYLLTHGRLLLPGKAHGHFRLRALFAHGKRGMPDTIRLVRLGRHYYPASLRTPRWPSPAFDRMLANGGMNVAPELAPHRRHLDLAILAITRRCPLRCAHCYAAFQRSATDVVPVETWVRVVRELERLGTSIIVLSGGEPMQRYEDVLAILERSDRDLTDLHLHTSGAGVTAARARELARRGLVAAGVGLDFPEAARHDAFRRTEGAFRGAVDALTHFADAGVFTYTNLCLTREITRDGGLERYLDLARELRVGAVQLLEPKPCGRYASRDADELFGDQERARVREFFRAANRRRRWARHPPVAYSALFERPERFGCQMGGRAHLAVDGNGDVTPCVFVPVSFGSVLREDVGVILQRMRAAHAGLRLGACPAVVLRDALAAHRRQTGRTVHHDEFRPQWDELLSAGPGPSESTPFAGVSPCESPPSRTACHRAWSTTTS